MCREAKGDNVLLLAELLKLDRDVALMTVKDDHAIYPLPSYVCMPVEVRIQSIAVSLSVQPFGEVLMTQEGGRVGVGIP